MQTSDRYIHILSTTADGYAWESYIGSGNAPKTDQFTEEKGLSTSESAGLVQEQLE
jgi:hypothetical protein